jgi:hypothetical protein
MQEASSSRLLRGLSPRAYGSLHEILEFLDQTCQTNLECDNLRLNSFAVIEFRAWYRYIGDMAPSTSIY